MSYIERLIRSCELAKATSPISEFKLKDLNVLNSMKQAIYVIEEIGGDIEKTFIFSLKLKKLPDGTIICYPIDRIEIN